MTTVVVLVITFGELSLTVVLILTFGEMSLITVVLVITFGEMSFPFCRDEAMTLLDIWEGLDDEDVFGIVGVVLENASKKIRDSSAVKNSFSESFILNG